MISATPRWSGSVPGHRGVVVVPVVRVLIRGVPVRAAGPPVDHRRREQPAVQGERHGAQRRRRPSAIGAASAPGAGSTPPYQLSSTIPTTASSARRARASRPWALDHPVGRGPDRVASRPSRRPAVGRLRQQLGPRRVGRLRRRRRRPRRAAAGAAGPATTPVRPRPPRPAASRSASTSGRAEPDGAASPGAGAASGGVRGPRSPARRPRAPSSPRERAAAAAAGSAGWSSERRRSPRPPPRRRAGRSRGRRSAGVGSNVVQPAAGEPRLDPGVGVRGAHRAGRRRPRGPR